MNNKPIILSEYGAVILDADMNTPRVKPGNKFISRRKKVEWEDATPAQKENLKWTSVGWLDKETKKFAFIPLTAQERQMLKENEEFHTQQMLQYILTCHGMDYGLRFAEENNLNIKDFHYCKYDNQCNIFCEYYNKGECTYDFKY